MRQKRSHLQKKQVQELINNLRQEISRVLAGAEKKSDDGHGDQPINNVNFMLYLLYDKRSGRFTMKGNEKTNANYLSDIAQGKIKLPDVLKTEDELRRFSNRLQFSPSNVERL